MNGDKFKVRVSYVLTFSREKVLIAATMAWGGTYTQIKAEVSRHMESKQKGRLRSFDYATRKRKVL